MTNEEGSFVCEYRQNSLVRLDDTCSYFEFDSEKEKAMLGVKGIENPYTKNLWKYSTKHLSHFNDLDGALNVFGEKYAIIKKAVWYQLHGIILRDYKIQLGSIYEDTRVNLIIPLPSGKSKNDFKNVSKQIVRALMMGNKEEDVKFGIVEEPTSSHPEQYIGKVIERKVSVETGEVYSRGDKKGQPKQKWVTKYIPNKGAFDCDLLQQDEAFEMLSSPDDKIKETRAYFRQALDPIGKNEISKRLVDNLNTENERLRYFPPCTVQLFLQPKQLPVDLVEKGTTRRLLIPYIRLTFDDREEVYKLRFTNGKDTQKTMSNFIDHLNKTRTFIQNNSWHFSKEAISLLEELHKEIVYQGQVHSKKGFNYTFIVDTTLQNLLVKFACIIAGSRHTMNVEPVHVKLAYMDLAELFDSTLDFVTDKIQGMFDYGGSWKGARNKEIHSLKWLFENGALSKEKSKISIQEFKECIGQIFEGGDSTAKYHYDKFKRKGWIDSCQVGQHESKVWLTFNPEFGYEGQGVKGVKGVNTYSEIISEYLTLISELGGLTPTEPLTPSDQKDVKDDVILDRLEWDEKAKSHQQCSYIVDNNRCGDSPCNEWNGKFYCKPHFAKVQE